MMEEKDPKDMTAAEIEAARCDRLADVVDSCIEMHGYPSCREGERFDRWIERCFIPRPRDKAGEPVQFGDYDIDWDETDECRNPGALWDATAVDCNGNLLATAGSKIVAVAKTDESGRVKRRAPEVLGADGLPIVEGETVWLLDGTEGTVKSVDRGNATAYVEYSEYGWTPCVSCSALTHTPPDTQERIDGDVRKEVDEYWGCVGVACGGCPVKIDGKTPAQRYNATDCETAKFIDLLRRQRELDARKGGE